MAKRFESHQSYYVQFLKVVNLLYKIDLEIDRPSQAGGTVRVTENHATNISFIYFFSNLLMPSLFRIYLNYNNVFKL